MKDNFSGQAGIYAKYRPSYPQSLIDYIIRHVTEKNTAWDCATGNGQTAKELALQFDKVFATDISQQQLNNATRSDNIIYSVQPAEKTVFADNTFDLITVSQALHWFRFDEFYNETKRVGKPGAILAAWAYSLLKINPAIDLLIRHYHFNTLKEYWDDERKYVDEEYKTIPFPFREIPTPLFQIEYDWTIAELEGYLYTWSALQKLLKANHHNPVEELILKIKEHWTTERMRIVFPIHLRLGRIEK